MGDRSYISVSENTTAKNALCLNGEPAGTYAPLTAPSFVTCIVTPVIKITTGAASGCVLTSGADGTATWETPSGGGLVWTGSTNNGIGTYSSSGTICSEPNLTFNGTTLAFAVGATRYITFAGAGSDTLCIAGAQNNAAKAGAIKIQGGDGTTQDGGDVCIMGGTGDASGHVYLLENYAAKLTTQSNGVCICDCAFASEFVGDKLRVNLNDYSPDSNIGAMFESSNNCEAVRIYGWTGSTTNNTALRVYNQGGTSGGGNCAIFASAVYSTPVSSGRSHGIWAMAGNKTNRYNYGVIGQLCGTQEGAGIVGVLAGWSTTLPAGCWAGVFDGNTHTCGTACVTTAVCTPLVCNPAGSTLCVAGATGVKVAASTTEGISVTSTIVCLNYAATPKLCTVTNGICLGANCGFGTDWVATSDCRLKTNITPISSALSIVSNLCGVYYNLCSDETKENRIGLIAQDVQTVLPEIVSHSAPDENDMEYGINDDKLGLKYDKLTAVLIEAIKELKLQNECLQTQINELNNK